MSPLETSCRRGRPAGAFGPATCGLALLHTIGCAGFAATGTSAHTAPTRHPNIVFILADDMGYGDPRCCNPESKVETPNLDRLAREGMRFTDAHAPGSVCVPSRYGLLTGRYPFRRRLDLRKGPAIRGDRTTVASLLKRNGYATAMVGKWHLGFDGGVAYDFSQELRGGPVDRGFDGWFGIPASLDIPPYFYVRDRAPLAPPSERIGANHTEGWTRIQGAFWRAGRVAPGFRHEEVLPRFIAEAVAYIERRAEAGDAKPFFLYLALPAPHTPWLPLERFRGKSGADRYGDFVMQVDEGVGQVLRALDRGGLRRNTIVFFSSDNGPVWYPNDVQRFAHSAVGPLRGMKGDAWEGGHRVPFLVRWPGTVVAGSACDRTVCFTDMLATFASIVGQVLPAGTGEDSIDILPLLRGDNTPVRATTILKRDASVIRQGRWKLITHRGSGGFSEPRRVEPRPGEPEGQLYDLARDIGETTNRWQEHPEIVARLLAALRRHKAQSSGSSAESGSAAR